MLNFSTTVTNSIATKLPLAGGTMTGALNISGTSALSTEFKIGNLTWNQNSSSTHGLLHQYRGSDGYSELQINNTASSGAVTLNIRNDSASVATIANDGGAYFAGKVGIGTTSLSHGLTVSDDTGGDDANFRRITIKSATHGVNSGFRFDSESANGTARGGGYYFQPGDTDATTYLGLTASDSAYQMVITREGRVGIGTASPTHTLNTVGASGTSVVQSIRNPSTSWSQYALTRYGTEGADFRYMDFGYYRGSAEVTRGLVIKSQADATLVTFLDSGNVGINEPSPQTKLHVRSGDSGGTVYNAGYNPLVLENSNHGGLQILTPNNKNGLIYFGDNDNAVSGRIEYLHANDDMIFVTAGNQKASVTAGGSLMMTPGGMSSHNGAVYIIGSVSNYSTANGRYIHVQLSTANNHMFHIFVEGYVYTTGYKHGRCSGYVYNWASGGNGATGSGSSPGVYDGRVSDNIVAMYSNQNNARIELVLDTGNAGTGNRWGSFSIYGGVDHITAYTPIEVVQYTTSSAANVRQFSS